MIDGWEWQTLETFKLCLQTSTKDISALRPATGLQFTILKMGDHYLYNGKGFSFLLPSPAS